MLRIKLIIGLFCLFLQLHVVSAFAAGTPEQQCQEGKNKVAGQYATCRQNAEAKLAVSGDATKYGKAISKCGDKFAITWQKLEDKAVAAGTTCPSVGDATSIDGKVTATANTVATLVSGVRFEDDGNGTVMDHQTGLQWEQKTTDGSAHDVNNVYSWPATDFLASLNGGSKDGVMLEGCFADHCDWRLPTIVELREILFLPYPSCALVMPPIDPCIDPVFGPASSAAHWSATGYSGEPLYAWTMDFYPGYLDFSLKDVYRSVRAVRGGS